MRILRIAVLRLCVVYVLSTFTAHAATSTVGATPGSFKVSESGAATYGIPLTVPPGTAGMAPKLSLNYNSQGGNGLLGMGWSLGGLSAITRCPRTLAQDGVKGGVNLDTNDRFCLDGQRLIVISGVYGADGAEYRTERESYTKIVSYGMAGTGPAWFKVWTKSGQIMEYGNTADSRIEAQGKTEALVWALNKVSDTVSNYMTVSYTEDNANGQYYPARIDYTGNSTKGTAPYNSVQFGYETRPDIVPLYVAGSLVKSAVRMTNVKSYAGASMVREYRLVYGTGTSSGYSIITSLTECAGDGVCFNPFQMVWLTEFGSLNNLSVFEQPQSTWNGYTLRTADVNGDGKSDLVWNFLGSSNTTIVATANGDGTFTALPAWIQPQITWDGYALHIADVNGDGNADLVWNFLGNSNTTIVALSNGDGTFTALPAWIQPQSSWSGYSMQAADVNGDGRADLIWNYLGNSNTTIVALSNGDGTFTALTAWTQPQTTWDGYSLRVADFNGDGKADLVWNYLGNNNTSIVALSNGDGTFTAFSEWTQPQSSWEGWTLSIGDINGDDKADLIWNSLAFSNATVVALSKGDGAFIVMPTSERAEQVWNGYVLAVTDLNGDGRSDLVWNYLGASSSTVASISKGDGTFTQLPAWSRPESTWDGYRLNVADVTGNGKAELIWNYLGNSNTTIISQPNGEQLSLSSITNGLGVTTSITYKPLTDSSVYTKDTGSVYPALDVQAPIYVVSESSTSDGIGGSYSLSYRYGGMKADLHGRGLLGFRWIETTDANNPASTLVTRNEYLQDYPYTGLPSYSSKTVNGVLTNSAQNTYTSVAWGGTRYAVNLTRSVETSHELNGSLVTTVTTDNAHDSFGNPTSIIVSIGDGYSKTTANTYTNDSANWILGRLTQASVTSTTPAASLTRTSSFAYDTVNGLLKQEVIEPQNTALKLTTDYTYDSYGNKTTVTVSGADIATRSTTTVYDSLGQFPVTTTNALNQSDSSTYDARFGKPATLTGPNQLTTSWTYDGFGRKTGETRADGTQTNVEYRHCDATCPSLAKYYAVTTTTGAPVGYAYYDMLNREIRTQVQGFDGRLITKDTVYDNFGRVERVSRPYYAGDSPQYTSYTYDALNRVVQETAPDGGIKAIAYNGLTTIVTNALNQTETRTKNSQGQLVSVKDHLNNTIAYEYDPFGNLTKTTDPNGNQIVLGYDLRGRKTSMTDPDMGYWTYAYNVLGELTKQTDAKQQVVTMSYDVLGRMLSRNEPDLISTWKYDTAAKGIGKLAEVSSDNGFKRVYTYDSFGRPWTETTTIDTTYAITKTYDSSGRVDVITYPTGFAVKQVYNAYGHLSEVKDNAAGGVSFWKGNAKDADGHFLNETLGNGVMTQRVYDPATGRVQSIMAGKNGGSEVQNQSFVFDKLGNLTERSDAVLASSESFTYDGLNRLLSAKKGANTISFTYDSIGNITSKSDVGNYGYTGSRPHAVTQTSGLINTTYTYDANGNMTGGNGRTIVWASYNLPTSISSATASVSFVYDADRVRIKQIAGATTTYYLNPRIDAGLHYEKEVNGNTVTHLHHIYGGAGVVAVYTTSNKSAPKTQYFHQDHLGSIVVVTSSAGTVTARYTFDSWGKRVAITGTLGTTHHGYTGHEHLNDLGLIHMNGRVYDPVLGRFLSADPHIQSPGSLQSYNRYSYVWNNPLSATDPSGYFKLSSILKFAAAVAIGYFTGVYFTDLAWSVAATQAITTGTLNAMLVGAAMAGGFVGGLIATGSLQGGLNGALTAGLMFGIGDLASGSFGKVIGKAAIGCLNSVAGGGKCGSGAASAGFAEFVGPRLPDSGFVGNVVQRAVAGGVESVLGGGKFENGAKSSAFMQMFTEAADYYDKAVGRKANPLPGENREGQTMYVPDQATGRQRPVDQSMGVIGLNREMDGTWRDFFTQGGPLSKVLNVVPIMNAIAGLHDYWFNEGNPKKLDFTLFNNVGTMLPAALISTGAVLGNFVQSGDGYFTFYLRNQEKK